MAATKYTYSISVDFPSQAVATDRLSQEIQDSAIVTALDYINTNGDDCDIWFKDQLSAGDVTVLDGIVAAHSGIPLPEPTQDINIKTSDISVPSEMKGFQDLTGHDVYRLGDLLYDCVAGETNIFMESFAAGMYLEGGGVRIPEYTYVSGSKVDNKPEKGDYLTFDMVDIDNVLGYGNLKTITTIERTSNVATATTSVDHGFTTGDVVCITCSDGTYEDMEEAIASTPSSTTFTYANIGSDESSKSVTGEVGVIVVLGGFVPKDYVSPNESWQCIKGDAKYVPAGIYLRFRYVSTGSTDVVAMPFYSLRT